MKKLILSVIILLATVPAWSAVQWRAGTGETTIDHTSAANLIGYNSYNKIVQPLDNLLGGYCTEYLAYSSSSILTVKAGACVVSNAGGTIRMFMLDSADTNLTAANLDVGVAFATGTTYYVYATSPNATTQASTYYISTSNTSPSGQTYYQKIGSFITDTNGYITTITNIGIKAFNAKQTKTAGATYQALTDGIVNTLIYCGNGNKGYISTLSDSASSPTTAMGYATCADCNVGTLICEGSSSIPVKQGDYYSTAATTLLGSPTYTVYFTPNN